MAQASKTDQTDVSGSNGAVTAANPLDFEELTELIRMVHETDIVEMELKSKKFSLAVRKKEAIEPPEPVFAPPQYPPQQGYLQAPQQQGPPQQQQQQQQAPQSSGPVKQESAPDKPRQDGQEVASPMAGTFYRSPAPGEPPFVRKGDKVTKGQTVGIVEAMKLMNEIEADVSGEVVDFLVENGKPITVGQGFILIK